MTTATPTAASSRRPADLAALRRRVAGVLHTSEDPSWDQARAAWVLNVDQRPLAVLEVRDAADVQAAADNGAVDVYLPTDTWHGFLIGASFVVSLVAPPGLVPEGATGEEAAALLITELAAGEGADLMSIDGTPWVRVESVEEADPARADIDVGTRRVEYLTPHPDIPQRWIIVAFSCTGAGDPTDEVADVTVRLFDAIMGTWRWIERGDPFDGPGNPLL